MFYLRAYGDRENKRVTYMDTDGHDLTFFFFNDTATTEIYTLSLHDALPISVAAGIREVAAAVRAEPALRNYQNSAYHNVQALRQTLTTPRRRRGGWAPPPRPPPGRGGRPLAWAPAPPDSPGGGARAPGPRPPPA